MSQSTTADANTETLIADHSEDRTRLEITLEQADALTLEATADVVIAAAFLDLVDADAAVPALEAMLEDGGLLYAPITYDGGTGFAPRDPLDSHLEQAYHRHMDEHRDGGRSDAGRHLLTELPARDWTVLESGGSNWIVRPSADNGYPDANGSSLNTFSRLSMTPLRRWSQRRRQTRFRRVTDSAGSSADWTNSSVEIWCIR